MTEDTYNGWTNRATWLVDLWVTNDEPTYRLMQQADLSSAQKCKEFVLEQIPKSVYLGILRDIGTKYLPGVDIDWEELCEAWNEK